MHIYLRFVRPPVTVSLVCVQRLAVLVLDLSQIDAVDATGMGTLFETKRRCEESGGKLVLLHPAGHLLRLWSCAPSLRSSSATLSTHPTTRQ